MVQEPFQECVKAVFVTIYDLPKRSFLTSCKAGKQLGISLFLQIIYHDLSSFNIGDNNCIISVLDANRNFLLKSSNGEWVCNTVRQNNCFLICGRKKRFSSSYVIHSTRGAACIQKRTSRLFRSIQLLFGTIW